MRIEKAKFQTASLKTIRSFYEELLGLPVVRSEEESFTVKVGWSEITFNETESAAREGHYYHFAFTVPENKLPEAKAWIEAKTSIGVEAGKDISFSESWNSHSVYFEDPAGNILELIARHTMGNAVDRPFDPQLDLLGVSEIGVPTKDVPEATDRLEELGVMTYKSRSDSFNPVGDDEGLFILVSPGRRWHFTDKTAESFPFEAAVRGIGEMRVYEDSRGLVVEINK
ncbi:VOC family protein [Paenibacillus sp. N4]|uniref:VOC family protein n=1 Tax=Paenibacillus vietnamensis TaxID=2590547 RepID=UPI001CD17657|nr:VOC family protein [Paenibacillus vietnamensis]MCA0756158.1 VOC family protein [Paenibacillus vietnamensis]